jgi:hypothetical protein
MSNRAVLVLCLAAGLCACKKEGTVQSASSNAAAIQTGGSASAANIPIVQEQTGLFPANIRGRYGFIDKTGKVVLQPQYKRALAFSEGLAAVQDEADKWGFIDKSGTAVVKPQYPLVLPFREGLATVRVGDHFGAINRKGEMIIAPASKFAGIGQFFEGTAPTLYRQMAANVMVSAWGFLGKNGEFSLPPVYDAVTPFGEGLAGVREIGKRWGFIDSKGKYVIEPQFDNVTRFSEGLAAVERETSSIFRWGYIDKTGKTIITPKYTSARIFSEGLAAVQGDAGKWGFIDTKGTMVIQPKYDDTTAFQDGLSAVVLGNREIYIDKSGKVVWEPPK